MVVFFVSDGGCVIG